MAFEQCDTVTTSKDEKNYRTFFEIQQYCDLKLIIPSNKKINETLVVDLELIILNIEYSF